MMLPVKEHCKARSGLKQSGDYDKISEEKLVKRRRSMENKDCPCRKKKCERHGKCDECRAHHEASKRQRPVACERKKRSE